MIVRTLTCAVAAAVLSVGASAQAAAPLSTSARTGASLGNADQLAGNSGWLPVALFMLAVLAVIVSESGDDDDVPVSP